MPEKETSEKKQDKIVSKNEVSEEANPENSSQNDGEDLLYTHKPENRGSSMQWNSAFCRRPGH
jgi:hypothetical protein